MSTYRRLLSAVPLLLLLLPSCRDDEPPTAPAGGKPMMTLAVTGFPLLSVDAGAAHTCGVARGGQAYCWGLNFGGQLGNGVSGTIEHSPVPVAGELTFTQVSAGGNHTCGVAKGGQAFCWGQNDDGELGNGAAGTNQLAPAPVAGVLAFTQVSAGIGYSCGVTKGGQAYCWGRNNGGQLGDGTTSPSAAPVAVAPPAGASTPLAFSEVSAGEHHTCGRTTGDQLFCWGDNFDGQLGNGGSGAGSGDSVPVPVAGTATYVQVSVGEEHTCAVARNDGAYCWGEDASGQSGNGAAGPTQAPAPVVGALAFVQVSAGSGHTCGFVKGGKAYCWGFNADGQLGNGTSGAAEHSPVEVLGGASFVEVSTGGAHSCGVTKGNGAYCWGNDVVGQLGNGTGTASTTAPSPVSAPN